MLREPECLVAADYLKLGLGLSVFVYLGEFWPCSHHIIPSSNLKCKDNDML